MDTLLKLKAGLVITVIGMGVTFFVLIFLANTFKMMELIFRKKKATKSVIKTENVLSGETISGNERTSVIAAVISAAIMSCTEKNTRLVVRSITRVGNAGTVWGKTGRLDQMASRMVE